MTVAQFPANAANSLIGGYCDDFVSFATGLAQTLEQISMRGLDITESQERLERLERGMRDLADAVQGLVSGGAGAAPPAEEPTPAFDAPPAAPAPAAPRTGSRAAPRPAPAPHTPPSPNTPPSTARPTTGPTTGPTGGAGGGPESATLKGTNDSMPLLSVVQFLGRMRKHGVLHVQVGDEDMKFELVNGLVQRTASTKCPPPERLGDLLVELGLCSPAAIEQIAIDARAARRPIGDAVLEAGLISHGQLLEVLEQQVHRRFARASKSKTASYWFEEKRCGPTDGRVRVHSKEIAYQQRGRV